MSIQEEIENKENELKKYAEEVAILNVEIDSIFKDNKEIKNKLILKNEQITKLMILINQEQKDFEILNNNLINS